MTLSRRSHMIFAALLAGVLLSAFLLASWSVWTGRRSACHAQNTSLNVLHNLLADARARTLATLELRGVPLDQRRQAVRFYDVNLKRIEDSHC